MTVTPTLLHHVADQATLRHVLMRAASRQAQSATARSLLAKPRPVALDLGGDPRVSLFLDGRPVATASFASQQ